MLFDDAFAYLTEARVEAITASETDCEGNASFLLVLVLLQRGQLAAQALCDEARVAFERAERRHGLANVESKLGDIARARDDFHVARRHYERDRAVRSARARVQRRIHVRTAVVHREDGRRANGAASTGSCSVRPCQAPGSRARHGSRASGVSAPTAGRNTNTQQISREGSVLGECGDGSSASVLAASAYGDLARCEAPLTVRRPFTTRAPFTVARGLFVPVHPIGRWR